MFADDTISLTKHKNPKKLQIAARKAMVKIYNWLCYNKLSLNFSKTHFITFCGKRNISFPDKICIGTNFIHKVNNATYLGINIDDKLNFKQHINHINNKLHICNAIIFKIKNYVNYKTLIQLYHAFAGSHLNYCTLAWGLNYPTHLIPLITSQKAIIRNINNLAYRTHTSNYFNQMGILDINKLIIYKTIINFLKKKSSNINNYSTAIHNTRSVTNKNFYIHSVKTNYGRFTTGYMGKIMTNHIKNILPKININNGKHIKTHILNKNYYSLNFFTTSDHLCNSVTIKY